MWRNTAAIMTCAPQWWSPRIMKPKGTSFMMKFMLSYARLVTSPVCVNWIGPSGVGEEHRRKTPTNKTPPRQYSGYQYQIVFSSYFSAWERGTWRWTVSTVRRVRSAHGVGGNREARYPKTFLFRRATGDSRAPALPYRVR